MTPKNGSPELTLSQQAYSVIEDMIISGSIPAGSYITEPELVEKTGLGRTPIREALQRLAREHMVTIRPRRGIYVPSLEYETELRILEVRRELDVVAVRLAARRASVDQRSKMRALAAQLEQIGSDFPTYAETIRETHQLLAAATKNTYLVESLLPLQNLSRRYWISNIVDVEKEIAASSGCHLRMLKGAADMDVDAAEKAAYDLNDYLVDYATRAAQMA
ncbi:GntR family transcriptional regulator [Brevibacterium sp. JSBI002]|uniref:GntR family transcriptional regulator n=1 Tax=Brevibacterium sp. JSBI002 TaxID=2886045 RepID=UPI0029FEF3C1|nr:GntR family transcriptional regulator [Brevibacterium sp. JSBI002]